MDAETRTYKCSPRAQVNTSVDPEGIECLIKFDLKGKYTTSDPGVIAVLDKLAANPSNPVEILQESPKSNSETSEDED